MENDFYLYQYTSLETLAIILSSKTIKFSELNLLDDPLEKYVNLITLTDKGINVEQKDLGRICFVSCWTQNEEESIAMWDMYGDRKTGVRIGLPSNMLDTNYNIYGAKKNNRPLYITSKDYFPIPQLIKVEYKNLEDYTIINKGNSITIDSLGRYKIPDWSFQNEYRFRIFASYEKNKNEYVYFTSGDFVFKHKLSFDYPTKVQDLLFKLDDDALSKIEIVVGPDISKGNRILFETLIEKYNIDKSRIRNSKYTDE